VPIGAAVIVLALRAVRKDQGLEIGRRADYFGAVLVTLGLMLLVYTIVNAEQIGWGQRKR